MIHRYTDGRAWFEFCRCGEVIIEAHVYGVRWRLSRRSIPVAEARILAKYQQVLNVWIGPTQLWATGWFRPTPKPSQGHLYSAHACGFRP